MSLSGRARKIAAAGSAFAAVTAAAVGIDVAAGVPSQAQSAVLMRAGSSAFPAGSAGIYVTFSAPLLDTNYAVVVQQTNTAGYSPTTVCTYFNPLHKTTTGFAVQHKTCADGTPVALDVGVSLNWIATPYQ